MVLSLIGFLTLVSGVGLALGKAISAAREGRLPNFTGYVAYGLALVICVAVWVSARDPETWFLGAIGTLFLFALAWAHAVRALTQQPDEAFPGRYDKPIWAFLFIILPPLGVIAYRWYRYPVTAKSEPVGIARELS